MTRVIIIFTVLIAVLAYSGCGKKGSDPVLTAPDKVSLTFPAQNAACTTGAIISASQSAITFTWNSAARTTSYDIIVKNLLTGAITTESTASNQLPLILLRNTPYAWYVISKSTQVSETAQSETWKFYNSGPGILSHPPFPADLLSPAVGQKIPAGTTKLAWLGADTDNDIAGYDVYLGTTASPPLLKQNVTDMFINSVTVTAGTTYCWKVVTKDAQGNSSDSGIFQFTVN